MILTPQTDSRKPDSPTHHHRQRVQIGASVAHRPMAMAPSAWHSQPRPEPPAGLAGHTDSEWRVTVPHSSKWSEYPPHAQRQHKPNAPELSSGWELDLMMFVGLAVAGFVVTALVVMTALEPMSSHAWSRLKVRSRAHHGLLVTPGGPRGHFQKKTFITV